MTKTEREKKWGKIEENGEIKRGPLLTTDLSVDLPPPKKSDRCKISCTSYRVWAPQAPKWGSGMFRRRRFGAGHFAPDIWAPGLSGAELFFLDSFFCSYVVSVCSSFARVRIEDSSRNRFALNGIQTRKIRIGNLVFLSIKQIANLSCKFDHF